MLKKYIFSTHFIKPILFQNINFFKKRKQIQGKIQNVDKVYLEIDFKTLQELK